MGQKSLVGRCAWVMTFAGVVVGCGDSSGSGSGGAAPTTAVTSSTGATSSTGTTSATSSGAGTGGGAPVSDCTALLLEECKQQKLCAPHQFALQWETDAICEAEAVRLCTALPSAYDAVTPGVADPAACTAAVTGTCDQYLKNLDIRPDACRPLPGKKLNEADGCLLDAQCGPDLFCIPNTTFPNSHGGCASFCTKYTMWSGTAPCLNSDNICDPPKGSFCTHVYDATTPNKIALPNSDTFCRSIAYQPLGGGCEQSTEQRCDSGLGCAKAGLPNAYKCVNLLSEGQACKLGDVVGKDPCDARLGLQCVPKPGDPTKSTCAAPLVVPINAQCGMVPDGNGVVHDQVCSNYAYCSATTNLCVRKSEKGDGCVSGGCYPPYQCTAGVCSDPALLVDPACTP